MKMKDTIIIFLSSTAAMLSPVVPLLFLVILFALTDGGFKIWEIKSIKQEKFLFKEFVSGIGWKMLLGCLLVTLIYLIEVHIGKAILEFFGEVKLYLIPTRLVAGFFITADFFSIDKHYENITGKSLVKSFKNYLLKLIRFKKEIENSIEEDK